MRKSYTILKRDSTSEGLLLEVLADDAAGFEALKSDFHAGRQLSPGTTVEMAREQTAYRLLNNGEWAEYNRLNETIDAEARAAIRQLSEDMANNGGSGSTGTGTGADYTFLKGLKYYAFGDSIVDMQGTLTFPETFGDTGYSTDLQNRDISGITVEGYVTAIEQRYGLVATNYGVSGGTIVAKANTMIGIDYSDVALVTIAYGVNDARTGVPLGTVNDTDLTTFAGALNQILRKIYTDNPECRVVILTPIQRLFVSNFGISTPNANGNYLIDFVNMCKKVAEKRSTKCIDMYRGCGINQTNLYYYTVEGVHPVNQGFARMKGAIIPVLDEMFAVEYEPFGVMTNVGDTEPDEPDNGGDTGEDTPPEEDISGGSVDLTNLFTLDGYYWGYNGNLAGAGTYDGVAPLLLEVGRTYTLTTIMTHDNVYAGGLVPGEGFTYAPHQFNCNKNAASCDRNYVIDGSTYTRVTFTFTPSESNPYVVFGKVKAADVSLCSLTYI